MIDAVRTAIAAAKKTIGNIIPPPPEGYINQRGGYVFYLFGSVTGSKKTARLSAVVPRGYAFHLREIRIKTSAQYDTASIHLFSAADAKTKISTIPFSAMAGVVNAYEPANSFGLQIVAVPRFDCVFWQSDTILIDVTAPATGGYQTFKIALVGVLVPVGLQEMLR